MTRTKKHALFVDDEVRVLEGLRRMLHSVRNEWDASFAESAEEALEIIETTHLNVVISDIRMPGVNGVEFFKKIKESHPRIVRIALSGQTPVENVIDSIGPVHQYLPKPCEGERLKATLNRVGELRRLLDAPRLVDVIT